MKPRIELAGSPQRGDWIEIKGDLCEGAPCTAQITERWFHGIAFKRWTGERVFLRFDRFQVDWSGERRASKRWFGISPRRATPAPNTMKPEVETPP